MAHQIALFAGPASALRPFRNVWPEARAYTLSANSDIAVLPYDEPLESALHRRYGTGDWPDGQSLLLSTTVQSFAAECTLTAPLSYLQTFYDAGSGRQSAVLWQGGRASIGPATLDISGTARQRPPSLWPVNVVLRAFGVCATATEDEFSVFGLNRFRDHASIHASAWPYRL
jgi:hypothetical protein